MSDDGFAVSSADLLAHADRVKAVAAGAKVAGQAGTATRPGPEAYGRLCTVVPVLLGELQGRIVDGVDAAAQSLDETADRLRTAAADYVATDERSAAGVRRAGRLR